MRLNKTEREALRKMVKIVIPQMKKSEIVNHFQKEGYPRRTIYSTINRMQNEDSIEDKKKTGRPTSWTSTRKNQLKELTNNRKGVSQRRLGRKFNVSHVTICRQLSKMNISCHTRDKTPK
jgi:transposase